MFVAYISGTFYVYNQLKPMMPEHIEPPQSPYPEDVSASAMFASCDHLWMPRLLRDRISPVP